MASILAPNLACILLIELESSRAEVKTFDAWTVTLYVIAIPVYISPVIVLLLLEGPKLPLMKRGVMSGLGTWLGDLTFDI